jgi:uncharacterized membrane protein
MILGSSLLWLPPQVLLALTLALFLGTELLTPDPAQWNQNFSTLQRLLLVPGGNQELWVNYPVLPWLELVTFGMLFAHWLLDDSRQAFKRALSLGWAFLLIFILLRYLDGFGNIRPRGGDGWIDFLNVVKYPPAMTFSLLTLGVNLLILSSLGRAGERWQRSLRALAVLGQVPLFFYLTHLFLYAALGRWFAPNGSSIPRMWPLWLLGLLILYPLCLAYGRLRRHPAANSVLRFL